MKRSKYKKKNAHTPRTGGMGDVPEKPWSLDPDTVIRRLDTAVPDGLQSGQVRLRRTRFGANLLQEIPRKSGLAILWDQLKSLIVVLLAAAAIVSLIFGDWIECLAIGVVIVINTLIGFITELRAVRSMEALRKLGGISARVRREGTVREVPAEELVPGDILLIEGGDMMTADLRIVDASRLQADESSLTGESLPVDKTIDTLPQDTLLAERSNMLFKGTAVTRGTGTGVVVETGMRTELGRISSLVQHAEETVTPLEKRLDQLANRLIGVTLLIAVLVIGAGLLTGKEMFLMIETGIALAVAAIPEGLPIVATLALARGMWRMARRNALIRRLSAVETLGSTTVIFTDKTGTLTENRMAVRRIALHTEDISWDSGEGAGGVRPDSLNSGLKTVLEKLLTVGVLCNNAYLQEKGSSGSAVGDPLETALLKAGAEGGMTRPGLEKKTPRVREEAFDAESKMMATFHKNKGEVLVAVKGAPEEVVAACTHVLVPGGTRKIDTKVRKRWLDKNRLLGEEGLRVIALAMKNIRSASAQPYRDLTLCGFAGLMDPPRRDVARAIRKCREAGIRTIMVTGDQQVTALQIGRQLGLVTKEDGAMTGREISHPDRWKGKIREQILSTRIFTRVDPGQKLDLVNLYQQEKDVVAMTGDGVNDAPALKKADIGVAMGLRGTQVAREAADMVLKDDAFSTIVEAVQQGRIIFNNIRKFVIFLLSCNISEVLAVGIAAMVKMPLPILPLQILFLNLVTDVFPALALGMGEGDPGIMKQNPRPTGEPIMTAGLWRRVAGFGFGITLAVLLSMGLALKWLDLPTDRAVTISFLTLALAQLWHVFNMRDRRSNFWKNDITGNPYIWSALVFCIILILAALYIPGIAGIMKLKPPGYRGWGIVLGMSILPLMIGQGVRRLSGGSEKHSGKESRHKTDPE
jgi:Ca2+-transporting ATPase